jgi:hypothetical protein
VCDEFMSATYYGTNVSSGVPTQGSFVYTNSGGTTALAGGWYGAQNASGFSPTHKYRTTTGGGVQTVDICTGGGGFGGPSQRSLKKNIELIGKSKKGVNIYTFEFKDGVYADNYPGKWQGVMADEVEKIDGAVFNFKGVNWVDYKKLDVQFKKIKS